MSLLAIAGLGPVPDGLDDATLDALRALLGEHARAFLLGGGHLSLAEWAGLHGLERAALTAAGRRLVVEQAVRVGTAAQGDLAALRVQAEVDGGEAHDAAMLRTAVQAMARASREGGQHGG